MAASKLVVANPAPAMGGQGACPVSAVRVAPNLSNFLDKQTLRPVALHGGADPARHKEFRR
jgi:hypothetical protein